MVERDEQLSRSLEHPSTTDSESGLTSAGRRHFVRGVSFALPAVITLYHGAVLANSSSLRCLDNRTLGNPPLPANNLVNHRDTLAGDYVTGPQQVEVQTFTKADSPEIQFYYDSIVNVWRSATGASTEVTLPQVTALQTYVTQNYPGYSLSSPSSQAYAIAYIDDNGIMQALGNDGFTTGPSRELPALHSCWTSSHP